MTAPPSAPGRPLARRLRRDLLLVALATLLGGALRLWGLDLAPPGLHPDEAANAFEASCLRGLGAASDGRAWPLTFCMHGRFWVEGTYVWLVALAQGLPLSLAVQTRLPAALAGTALIPLAALLARRLVAPRAGWIAAALLAVEPLAVHYSRVGLRASLTPPLVAGALVLLLAPPRAPARDAARGALAGALASLALWTYTPMRAWVPLLLAAWVLAYRPRARRAPWAPALALGLVTLAFLAALPWTLAGDGSARLSEVSLTHQDGGPLALGARFLRGYALAFAPRALLSGSSGRGFWAEGVTPLLWTSAPLILLGLARLARRLHDPRARFLLLWLALYPLPGALTVDAPNPLRTLGVLPLWALLGALGARALLGWARVRGGATPRLAGLGLALALGLNAVWTSHAYRVRFPARERAAWFAAENEALTALVRAADERGAEVELTCSWVTAALAQARARHLGPQVEHGDPARVRFGAGPRRWRAELDDRALVAWEDGREVFFAPVRRAQ